MMRVGLAGGGGSTFFPWVETTKVALALLSIFVSDVQLGWRMTKDNARNKLYKNFMVTLLCVHEIPKIIHVLFYSSNSTIRLLLLIVERSVHKQSRPLWLIFSHVSSVWNHSFMRPYRFLGSISMVLFLVNMNENKTNLYIIIAVVTVVVVVIIAGLVMLFSGDDKESAAPTGELPPATTVVNTETTNSGKTVPGVYKDSILKSTDSGANFETYFAVATTSELAVVDVLSITFDPLVQDRIVVSSYDDGLFLNEKKINLWQPIPFPPQKIYSFILDNKSPATRAFASGVVADNGRIFRTDDNGVNWRAVYVEPGLKTYVSALTQDPMNQEIIIAGTSAGTLVRSIDGGDTWNNIGQEITGKITHFTHDSVPTSLTYLMVGSDIYHSYDTGLNWLNWEDVKVKEIKDLRDKANEASRAGNKGLATALKDQATALQARNKTEGVPSGIVTIVADPSISGVLYAGLTKGLYRSTDYGKYWKPVNIIESAEKFPILSIAVNPDDSNEISFVAGNAFYRSVNNGMTWAITPLDKTRNASFVAYDPFDTSVIFVGLSAKK